MAFWLVFLTAFALALIFTPIAIKIAPKIGAVDVPKDDRRMHTKPVPRFGGLAIFIGTTTALIFTVYGALPMYQKYFAEAYPGAEFIDQPVSKMTGVIVGGVLIYILGVIDDLKGMPAKVKLLGQLVCGGVAYYFGVRINFVTNHFSALTDHIFFSGAISLVITLIWIAGITNTVNLIDGLDGLSSGISSIASLCLAYTAYIHGAYLTAFAMLALAGGALGFLPYNFHPAKIFMGDGGSLFLGYMLATLSIVGPMKGATVLAMIGPVLVLGVPIFDTGFAILRRLANHRPIMEADKGHLHHRLMAAGMGQRRTVLTLYGISGDMGVAAVLFSRDLFVEMLGLVAIAAMYIYIFLTDANHWKVSLKAVPAESAETQINGNTEIKIETLPPEAAEKVKMDIEQQMPEGITVTESDGTDDE